jgi:hypothetical protein
MANTNKTEVISEPKISTTAQIQAFLKMFVELTGILYVDDDNYVRCMIPDGEDEYVEISVGKDEVKMLVLYSDNIKNYQNIVILNPFTESTILTPDREWFYAKLLNNALSLNANELFRQLQVLALESKKTAPVDKKSKKKSTPPRETFAHIELLSPILSYVTDEKMLEEFDSVANNIKDGEFLNVYYNRKDMTAKLHCALLNPDIEKAYPNIRKKTWENWRKIIEIVFGDIRKNYTVRAELIGCPQLDSTTKCWHALFSHAGKYFDIIGIHLDVDALKEHIDNLQIYHSKAKWLTQAAVSSKTPTAPVISQPTSAAPSALKITGVPNAAPVVSTYAPPVVPQYARSLNVTPSTMGNTPYGGMPLPILTSGNRISPMYSRPNTPISSPAGIKIDMSK